MVWKPRMLAAALLTAALLTAALSTAVAAPVAAEASPSPAEHDARDGVYERFDGDVDLGLGLGVEFGSAGHVAPALRASAHYFSIAGVYAEGRLHTGGDAAPSLFAAGVDLRPLFVARWAKGFETGPGFLDLTLDSLALSVGAFFASSERTPADGARGLEAGLGGGVPLTGTAAGPWLEARGVLRFPEVGERQEALFLALAWHGFLLTPLSAAE